MKPKISAVITTRNSGKTLEKLLKSLKSQTCRNLEIIVVDNNSSDRTVEIAKKYTKKVYRKGPERSAQRNLGAEKSTGKYLLFLDSDMELTKRVVEDCVQTARKSNLKLLVIPEKTTGRGLIPAVRRFEREMYMDDLTVEVARFFERPVFFEFGGYDLKLTGPEDYDLPYRIGKKYKIGRSNHYILHNESGLTLFGLLRKKYYYASRGALYASKHPELISLQGNILFRKAYFKNWKKFVGNPLLGVTFIFVRILETMWAVTGYINTVGLVGFVKSLLKMHKIS